MKPPADAFAVNIHRNSNPFDSNDEPDWVRISGSSDLGTDMNDNTYTEQTSLRYSGCELLDISPTQPETNDQQKVGAFKTQDPRKAIDNVKTPPPIPRKPISLSSKDNSHDSKIARSVGIKNIEQPPPIKSDNTIGPGSHIQALNDLSSLEGTESISASHGPDSPSHTRRYNEQRTQQDTSTERITNDLLSGAVDENIAWKPLI